MSRPEKREAAAIHGARSVTKNGTPSISFRLGELMTELEARGSAVSRVAKRDLGRYYEMVDEYLERFAFTEAEALLLCDAGESLVTSLQNPGASSLPMYRWLWAQVADAIRERDLATKYGVTDPENLVERVRALEPAEGRALIDALERYRHARAQGRTEDNYELLRQIGLIRT